MNKEDYLKKINNLTAGQIARGISSGVVTFKELQKTGEFPASKQKNVKAILSEEDDAAFKDANTKIALENYLLIFPDGNHKQEAERKLKDIVERERMIQEIIENRNQYTPEEIINKLSDEDLIYVCKKLGIDAEMVRKYKTPELRFNDIPQSESDIPPGYTDVFFWGIPTSGKTCALSAILSTIKKNYSMEAPDIKKKFGATYRDSLTNIFRKDYGYLPQRTNLDRTQYMPFLFYQRGQNNKRKIAFFELSGEVFQFFYEKSYSIRIIEEAKREAIENSFQTLELLLKSNNQKIHFFFIDYNQETKYFADDYGLTQSNYLDAAAIYFRDNNEIFKKKTDAVYVIVTKSDEIPGNDKAASAKSFLDDNFGAFMDVLKTQCKTHSVDFKVKRFSIGDVYFKRICKIKHAYSTDIINDLLNRVKPAKNSKFRKIFNS